MRKILLLQLMLFYCGIACGQYDDRIITIDGKTIKCKILKVDNDWIYYQKFGPDDKIEIKLVKSIKLDRFTERKVKLDSLYANFRRRKAVLDTIAVPVPADEDYIEYRHVIMLSPLVSVLNNLSLKYEYRFSNKNALKSELGYIHSWNAPFKNWHFDPPYKDGYPFAWSGVYASAGIRNYFRPYSSYKKKSLSVDFFYKHQFHERYTTYYNDYDEDYELTKRRSVYGTKILFSVIRVKGNFLIEFFAGVSLRYYVDKNVYYSGYSGNYINMLIQSYHPPRHKTSTGFLPAIQGGINIGFGFNGKKKE